jgi:hypothetical protein
LVVEQAALPVLLVLFDISRWCRMRAAASCVSSSSCNVANACNAEALSAVLKNVDRFLRGHSQVRSGDALAPRARIAFAFWLSRTRLTRTGLRVYMYLASRRLAISRWSKKGWNRLDGCRSGQGLVGERPIGRGAGKVTAGVWVVKVKFGGGDGVFAQVGLLGGLGSVV